MEGWPRVANAGVCDGFARGERVQSSQWRARQRGKFQEFAL
ncbi:hypothetical protein IMCC12053_2732 [Celeribacter marinus]|uniref:Uncharacterized protein n=1 Tax=Celeribacter marinus TaxID=1397108 RepID=A0A0P0ADW3_9RHOB|nr:hypothetical protein IMCC12053_2732 [Celeribacter marinus]